jgi:hypothetical protein
MSPGHTPELSTLLASQMEQERTLNVQKWAASIKVN